MRYLLIAAASLIGTLAIPSAVNAQAAARHYDCTKAGNANKAACKSAAAAPAATPVASAPAASTPAGRHYDCSKPGNANKAACKSATTARAPAPAPAPAPAAPIRLPANDNTRVTSSARNTNPGGPNGASAKCRDNTYSFSAHHSGTCSHHGGVAQFY